MPKVWQQTWTGHNGLDAMPLADSRIKGWLIKLHSFID